MRNAECGVRSEILRFAQNDKGGRMMRDKEFLRCVLMLGSVLFIYCVSQCIKYPTWLDFAITIGLMGYIVKKPLLEIWREVMSEEVEIDD